MFSQFFHWQPTITHFLSPTFQQYSISVNGNCWNCLSWPDVVWRREEPDLEHLENRPTSYQGERKKLMVVTVATKQTAISNNANVLGNESDVPQAATIMPRITFSLLTFSMYLQKTFFQFQFHYLYFQGLKSSQFIIVTAYLTAALVIFPEKHQQ